MTEYNKALSILKKASRSGSRLGLDRIKELLSLAGDPQDSLRAVHISGTNGKGSFSAMLSSVLTAAGYKTGTFMSPAMVSPLDQIRIDGETVSEELFADAILRLDDLSSAMDDKPTEFELMTAAAFLIMKEQCCAMSVIECGLGGDGDSTNVINEPLLSVITNVSLDHCTILGRTTADIARHKSGIIKPGVPVYYGGRDTAALEVIRQTAERKGSELYIPDRADISFSDDVPETSLVWQGTEITVPLRGVHQRDNVVNVLSCVEILRGRGVEISNEAVRKGLSLVRLEGRFETLCADPYIIFDGAHNPDGMDCLCRSIAGQFGDVKPVILIGVLADKDYSLYAEMLSPLAERIFTVAPDNPRALDPATLAETFSAHGLPAEPFDTITEGFDAAAGYAGENSLPLMVIGSLYLYKDIKSIVQSRFG